MRQRSPSKSLHEKVQKLKNNTHLTFHNLARVLKILPLPPEERTFDDITLLMEATRDFSFFWKFYENEEEHLHEQCCQNLHVEYYSKGSVVIRQGDEGDKMFLVLSGELDVYTMKTELESKQYYQEQLEKESSIPVESLPETKKSVSNLSNKSRSPRRRMATAGVQKETSIPSVPTEEDMSPTYEIGRKATEGDIDSDRSVSDGSPFLYTRFRKLKPSKIESLRPTSIRTIDIRELAYFANLDALKENKELLWDGINHLRFLNTAKSGAVLGEMALAARKKRGATVIAMEDCIMAVLRREEFNKILSTHEKQALEDTLEFFRHALRVNLSQSNMFKLSRMFQEEKATFRQTIFHEGNHAEGFYIVKSGEVLAQKAVKYPVEDPKKSVSLQKRIEEKGRSVRDSRVAKKFGLQYPIKALLEGQLLGEEILIGKDKRVFTAVCQSETASLLYISKEKFERFFSRLKDVDIPLLQKISSDFELVQVRLSGIEQYIENFVEVSRPQIPLNQNLKYSQRVSTTKIKPLHNALSDREGNKSPSVERQPSAPQLDNASTIFILSEVQTPKFSKSATATQDKEFLRCHKINEEALEVSCDTIKHVTGSNEKILKNMLRAYAGTGDPFILKEYPNINAKERLLSYRKCRSLTPENREKFFEELSTAKKMPMPFSLNTKEENRLSLNSRCRRLLKRVFEPSKLKKKKRSLSPLSVDDRSRERSQRELKEKSLIQNLPMRSASSPSIAFAKGSLLSIMTLKGKNQPQQSTACNISTYSTSKTPSVANDTGIEVSSFMKWSEKEKGDLSGVVAGSDKYNSLLAAFSDRNSNTSRMMDDNDRLSHFSFPLPEKRKPDLSVLKLKRRKSLEGTGGKSHRKKKQLNLLVKGKPGMQVIEEENPHTPNNLKTVQIPQKPTERKAVSKEKRYFGPGGAAMPEQDKLVKSTMHSMFRFRNVEALRKNRRPGTVKSENSMADHADNSLKIVDIEMRKTART